MKFPYAELLEFNQASNIRREGFTRIRDQFVGLGDCAIVEDGEPGKPGNYVAVFTNPERMMEFAGRWDYGSKNAARLGEMSKLGDTQVPIIQKYLTMGHESMIEMGDATFFIECSRVVSHELVRHRLLSVQQESQRFVKYDEADIDDLMPVPDGSDFHTTASMRYIFGEALRVYKELREKKIAPQIARYVFPNATRTRMVVKGNAREWRHILKLRMDNSAQPEMQELMKQIHFQLLDIFPNAMIGVGDAGRAIR